MAGGLLDSSQGDARTVSRRGEQSPAMPAHVIVETNLTDAERYEQYKAAPPAAIGACGAAISPAAAS